MGRWSRQLAPRFVEWLGVGADTHWIDVGCGTGALTDAICRFAKPASVVGCDPAQPLLEYARAHQADDRASFVLCGVDSLPGRSGGFGSVSSLFALNFFPDPVAALEAMVDRASGGATVSSCVWDYAGGMELLRVFWDAASRVDPKASELDEGRRFPICRPDSLTDLFRGRGLNEIRCEPIEISTDFSSSDEYWQSFQGGTGPAPSYVASLRDELRAVLSNELERCIPRDADGSIRLVARAWAVRGSR